MTLESDLLFRCLLGPISHGIACRTLPYSASSKLETKFSVGMRLLVQVALPALGQHVPSHDPLSVYRNLGVAPWADNRASGVRRVSTRCGGGARGAVRLPTEERLLH